MADVEGILKATEQCSSQGSNGGKWGPHSSMKGGNERTGIEDMEGGFNTSLCKAWP